MSVMSLPVFKYHPDPLSTDSIKTSSKECICCRKTRGFIYTGPVFAIEDYQESICPWCIADGAAHRKLDASFTDEAGVSGYGDWDEVSDEVKATVAYRTPGFHGWQQERWWTHCRDAAQYIGRAGYEELLSLGSDAIAYFKESTGAPDGPDWEPFFKALDTIGSPTAYMFRCSKCGKIGGYWDCD
jgi:uncharacterized protein CbrC (UPF0167 family)